MLKKVLIGIGVLVILLAAFGIGGMMFLKNKIETNIAEKEPEFRQYVTMTTEEQNAYVEKNFFEFFGAVTDYSTREEEAKAALEQIKADPEALQAAINMGRSMVAQLILNNENILKDLSADVHNALQAEANEGDSRVENFKIYMEKYLPQENK